MEKQSRDGQEKTSNGNDEHQQAPGGSAKEELGQIDNIIGNFGRYQFLIFMFKILIGATSAFNNLGVTFFAPSNFIGFSCANPLASSSLSSSAHQLSPNISLTLDQPLALQAYQPTESYNTRFSDIFEEFLHSEERHLRHSSSNFNYDTPKNLEKSCFYVSPGIDGTEQKCTSFRYDTGIWMSTIIDEWDLVCDRAWFISLIQSLYMSGFIISFLMFGYLSDRFGRWRSLLLGALIEITSGFGCALSGSVTTFMIFRFLLGLGNAGRSSSSYLIMIEWVGPRWRMHISTLGSLGWVLGYCLMPWITLYFLHFRHMQLFICFYEIVFVVWLLCLPESPRWLLIHKRFDEAYEVLLRAAKFNGLIREVKQSEPRMMISLNAGQQQVKGFNAEDPSNVGVDGTGDLAPLQPYTLAEYDAKFQRLIHAVQCKNFTHNENKLSFIDLFNWKNLRKYALILSFVWAANSFIYYGIALRVGDFGGNNLFISFTMAGITEIPSIAFTIICMKLLPRKTTNLFIFMTTGLLCALQLPLKHYDFQWLQQSTMMLAKLFNSCSFSVILYQTMELFPTSIRQTAYSSCSLAGRIGSILAPFIKELAQVTSTSVPPMIYAMLCFSAALFIKDLPETQGSDLPDTLLEAENFQGTDMKEKEKETKKKVSSR